MNRPHRASAQRGFFLIEALVAILIFSIGILGMVALAGTAMGAQNDARYRNDAASLADELASDIVLNVNRTSPAAFAASLATWQHNPGGANCAFTGAAMPAGNASGNAWLTKVTTLGPGLPGLPGATAANQQVNVTTVVTPAGSFNRVQITICWRAPSDQAMRQHTLVSYPNGLV